MSASNKFIEIVDRLIDNGNELRSIRACEDLKKLITTKQGPRD